MRISTPVGSRIPAVVAVAAVGRRHDPDRRRDRRHHPARGDPAAERRPARRQREVRSRGAQHRGGNLTVQEGHGSAENPDCRFVFYQNSIEGFWPNYRAGRSPGRPWCVRRLAPPPAARRPARSACSTARPTSGCTWTSGSSRRSQTELGAQGGDFAEAYVVAHEYGHHIQNLYGILGRIKTRNGPASTRSASSSRPTAWPASGPTTPPPSRPAATPSSPTSPRTTSPRAWTPPDGRRRPHPGEDPGPGQPGKLQPRHRRTTHEVVQDRHGLRRHDHLRHLVGPARPCPLRGWPTTPIHRVSTGGLALLSGDGGGRW